MSTENAQQKARPNTVVVGFDGTPPAQAALHWAATEAKSRAAQLRIIIAWDPSPVTPWNLPQVTEWREQTQTEAQEAAEAARAAVGGGLDVEALAVEGSPGKVLADESAYADLLVVGSAGHVGLAGLLSGSVSRYLLHHTACPLVVLGPNAASEQTRRLVLSPTLDPDGETFDWVARWVARRSTPLYVVASFEVTVSTADLALPLSYDGVRDEAHQRCDAWIDSLRRALDGRAVVPVRIESSVIEGTASGVLERQTQGGDLLVVPAGCEHSVPLARGECPIAVVPVERQAATEPDREPDREPARRVRASAIRPATAGVR